MNISKKQHWETVYETKSPDEVSWTQQIPEISLNLIKSLNLNRSSKIIDIGGGDSKLVDYLLQEGFENITVLDISASALEKAKARLGANANKVTWIESDILDFNPTEIYDIWHDRAAFHFLTEETEINNYQLLTNKAVASHLIIGTFSEEGPLKCSGLEIKQYTADSLNKIFNNHFKLISAIKEDHITPFNTKQNFLFCSFIKNNNKI